jgi:hypothetical protein
MGKNRIGMVELFRLNRLPRFQALGQIESNLYFIDCYKGEVLKLSRDWRIDREYILTVVERL